MKYMLISIVLFMLNACDSTGQLVETLRDDTFTVGCVTVVEKIHAVGYFTTTNGGIEVCKLKCSENLPENYRFKHDDDRFGCHGSIGYESDAVSNNQ